MSTHARFRIGTLKRTTLTALVGLVAMTTPQNPALAAVPHIVDSSVLQTAGYIIPGGGKTISPPEGTLTSDIGSYETVLTDGTTLVTRAAVQGYGGSDLANPPKAFAGVEGRGYQVSANCTVRYQIKLGVLDGIIDTIVGNEATVIVSFKLSVGALASAGLSAPATASATAQVRLLSDRRTPSVVLDETVTACYASGQTAACPGGNVASGYLNHYVALPMGGGETWTITIFASAGGLASIFPSVGGQNNFSTLDAQAFADPIFYIDPNQRFVVDGVSRPATDFYEIQVSQGIEYIGPEDYPPAVTAHPATQTVTAGDAVTQTVEVDGPLPMTYQWYHNGAEIEGATNATHTLPAVQSFHAGDYSVKVTNPFGETTSAAATLTVEAAAPSSSRLVNLSTRAASLTGENVLIPGFVLGGSGTKKLLIRGVGPTLGSFGISGVLADPLLTLKRTIGTTTTNVATNDNWGIPQGGTNVADLLATTTAVGAFDLTGGSADAALLVDLEPGQYSVVTEGVGGGTGIAIVELYDADVAPATSSLINISTRGFVGTGEQVMIPGFVISSEGPKTLLIRAVGPTLADFNVSGTLADPRLVVNRTEIDGSNTPLLTQDNWGDNPDAANTAGVANQVGAFALTAGSADAAFVVTLPPGVYTVVGSSADVTSTGLILVEVYVVP